MQREKVGNLGMMGSLIQRLIPLSEEYREENWTPALQQEHARLFAQLQVKERPDPSAIEISHSGNF